MPEIAIDIDPDNDLDVKYTTPDGNDSSVKGSPKPHVGNPISMVEVSPKGKYLVYYMEKDQTIVVRDVNNKSDTGKSYKPNEYEKISYMCVSDKKILAYISDRKIRIIDMNKEKPQNIKLNHEDMVSCKSCSFNSDGKLILFCTTSYSTDTIINVVCVHSIRTEKTRCQKIYMIPKEADVISISKYNKIWLRFNDNIYVWEIFTGHTTIVLKNINEAKEIKILDDEENEYTLLKLNNEITVYSNKLGCPITSITLSEENEENEEEHKLSNFIIQYPSLNCSLFSLLDKNGCLKNLIKLQSLAPYFFKRIESKDYILSYEDNDIKYENVTLLNFNNHDNNNNSFGKYQIEKNSIIWKIKMEVLEKQAEESEKKIIEDNINYLVNKFKKLMKSKNSKIEEDLSQSVIDKFNKHATTKEMKEFEKELSKYTNDFPNGDIDDINVSVRINKLVNKAINRPIKKKIRVDLEEFFTKKIEAKYRNQDETKNQDQDETKNPGEIINELKNLDDPVEIINKFSSLIHITTFEDLEEDNIDNIYKQLKDEAIKKINTKNFVELINGKVNLGDELNKLIRNFYEFKNLVKDIIKQIKIVESMENDIKDIILQAKDPERENKLNDVIKKIENIKIDKFMENFIKKIENLQIKGLENFQFVDFSKEDKDIITNESVKKFIDDDDIEEIKNNDNCFKIKFKVLENFKKKDIKDIENINNSTTFVKKIIKIGLLNDFINKKSGKNMDEALSKDLSKVDEKNEELVELVNDFIEDIVTIRKEGLEKNVIENIKQEDQSKDSKQLLEIFISKIKLAILEESSKNFVRAIINSKIKKLKDELIRVIRPNNPNNSNQDSNINEKPEKSENIYSEALTNLGGFINSIRPNNSDNSNQEFNNNEKPYIEALRKFLEIIDKININKIIMFENINSKKEEQEINQFETIVMEYFNKEMNDDDTINQMTHFIDKIKELEMKDLNKWKSAVKSEVKNLVKLIGIAKELDQHEKPDIIIIEGVAKIDEELEQDFVKQIITKIEDIEDIEDHLVKLKPNFINRVTKVKKLGKDPNNLEIRIDENLVTTKDLIRLFCSDSDLNRITTSIYSDDSDSKIYLNILAYDELLNSNEIVILTNIGIFIFHLNLKLNKSLSLNEKLISLKHFYYIYQPEQSIKSLCHVHYFHTTNYLDRNIIGYYGYGWRSYKVKYKDITKYYGPTSLMLTHGWASYVKDNGEDFLKYGAALLMFAIELNDLELIDGIYKKCLKLFSQNLEKNKAFLSIITTSMPLLNDFYPEYVEKYSSDTNLIIDSLNYKIEYLGNSHLHPFSDIEIVDLSPSIYWLDYAYNLDKLQHKHNIFYKALLIIQLLIYFLTFPISFPIFYILNYFHVINQIHTDGSSFFYYLSYYFISEKIKEIKLRFQIFPGKPKPTITFLVPYIKFVNYPQNYNWFMEFFIRPNPNPFVKTINRAIYETWGGEAMINFKWEKYGRYYYAIIWIIFAALLGCFTAATTLSEDYISEKDRKILYISSIFLGIIHLIIELRQFIYDPIAWISDPWNYFDLGAYLLPTCTSIYSLKNDDKIFFLISISCLLLDLKFLLFFRVFESFGLYFVIIISVAKQIASFLIILFFILVSFAHAFLILLKPRNIYSLSEPPPADNNDINNPWHLTNTFNSNDGTPVLFQQPNANTNMFTDYRTSLFSMYLYLTGNPNALPNWEFKNNAPIDILMVSFSLLIAVYLMNLLIGLLNLAIQRDNNRVSYLLQSATILSEIELFYLLPNQRRWKTWFPDVIYYHANIDKTRREIKEINKDGEWKYDTEFPEIRKMRENLLKKLNIRDRHQQK